MLLGFKTELKINNQQRRALMKHCGVARHDCGDIEASKRDGSGADADS